MGNPTVLVEVYVILRCRVVQHVHRLISQLTGKLLVK